jgi:WD40 repeat protein
VPSSDERPGQAVYFWDVATGRLIRSDDRYGYLGRHDTLTMSRDGRFLATRSSEGVRVVELTADIRARRLASLNGEQVHDLHALAFSDDAGRLSAATSESVVIWNVRNGKLLRRLTFKNADLDQVPLSPDGRLVAVNNFAAGPTIWDLGAGVQVRRFPTAARALAFTPDNKGLALDTELGALEIRELSSGKTRRTMKRSSRDVIDHVAFSGDGRWLAAAAGGTQGGNVISLCDVASGAECHRFRGHAERISALAFSPGGGTLAAGDNHGRLWLWDTATGTERLPMPEHRGPVWCVAFSPDGRYVASGSEDETIRLWQPLTGQEVRRMRTRPRRARVLAFSRDGTRLTAAFVGATRGSWDVRTGRTLHTPDERTPGGGLMIAASDGSVVLTPGPGMEPAQLWDTATGKWVRNGPDPGPKIDAGAAVGPGGWLLAVGPARDPQDSIVSVWDLRTGKVARRLRADEYAYGLTFSPDGRTLAAGGSGFIVWETATGKQTVASRTDDFVDHLTFTPDGRIVASVDGGLTIWLREAVTGQGLGSFSGHVTGVAGLAFSPDGRMLASAGMDATVLVWDTTGMSRLHAPPTPLPGAAELDRLWDGLRGPAPAAWRAVWRLAAAPREAVPLVARHLHPADPLPGVRLERLAAQLDDPRFASRERATRELRSYGDRVGPFFRHLLAGKPSLEVRRRVDRLLNEFERWSSSPEELRRWRALAVLEHAGTPEARQVLQRLAKGVADAWLTREAKAALERLEKRTRDKR